MYIDDICHPACMLKLDIHLQEAHDAFFRTRLPVLATYHPHVFTPFLSKPQCSFSHFVATPPHDLFSTNAKQDVVQCCIFLSLFFEIILI